MSEKALAAKDDQQDKAGSADTSENTETDVDTTQSSGEKSSTEEEHSAENTDASSEESEKDTHTSSEDQEAQRRPRSTSAMKLAGRIIIGIGGVILLIGMIASIRYALSSDDASDDAVLITDDGVYSVPDQIPPGKYRSPGGESCRWERLSSLDDSEESVIQSSETSMQAQIAVIEQSDAAFSTQGCVRWRKFT